MTTSTGTRAQEFRDQLSRRVLVADGAMGTMLYSRGVFINRCFDELNLSAPDLVRQIHQEYVKAGAEILETNTFGANRIAPGGVRLGRKAARRSTRRACGWRAKRRASSAFVAGAIGPLGVRIEPLGPTSFAEARAVFREQIEALVEAGVDLLILETFGNLDELREAVLAAREAAGDRHGHRRAGDHRRFRPPARRHRYRNLHPRDGCLAGGRDRAELLGGSEGHARNHRADDAVFLQADERHAQRRPAHARGGPQHLSLLAGVHGAIRAAPAVGRREDRRRLLRHHAGAHQADPLRDALAAAGAQRSWRSRWKSREAKAQALAPVPVAQKSKLGAKLAAGQVRRVRRDSAAARRGCLARNRRRAPLRRARASTASTFPTARAPARA